MRLINTTVIIFCLLLALGYSNGAPKPQSSSSEDEKIVFVAQPTEDQSQDEIVIIEDPVDIVTKPDANGATAVFVSSGQGGNVSGTIHFTETDDGVLVQGEIFGLQPGKHGFHIHKNGSLEQGCKAADSHFNPHNKNHGSKAASEHHVGDLGNVLTPEFGQTSIIIFDNGLSLDPDSPEYIVGRTIIVHEKVDDLGQGGDDESLKTGNAGARLACGIITLN